MNKLKIYACSLLIIVGNIVGNCPIAQAEEDKADDKDKVPEYVMDTSHIGETENGVIRSEQLLELGSLTPGGLTLEGEESLKHGSIDRALTVLQRSVEMAPMDMDCRILYAQTLQKKLMMQRDKKDPALFNFVVKQWYFIFKKADYLDEKMQGYSGLVQLTGVRPRAFFENAPKYFKKVLLPEDGSVKVVIGGATPANQKIAKKDDIDPMSGMKKSTF